MSFLQVVGKPDVFPNDETAPPRQEGEGDAKTICLQLSILTVFLQHTKVKRSLGLRDIGEISYV